MTRAKSFNKVRSDGREARRLIANQYTGVRFPLTPQKGTDGKIAEPELTTGRQLRIV